MGGDASLTSFFKELSVGGVARPVDALLMAGLILYSAVPFERAVKSNSRQLAFVFQAWRFTGISNRVFSLRLSTIHLICQQACMLFNAHA